MASVAPSKGTKVTGVFSGWFLVGRGTRPALAAIIGQPADTQVQSTLWALRPDDQAAFKAAGWKEGDLRVQLRTFRGVDYYQIDPILFPQTTSAISLNAAMVRVNAIWDGAFPNYRLSTSTVPQYTTSLTFDPGNDDWTYYTKAEFQTVYEAGESLAGFNRIYLVGDMLASDTPLGPGGDFHTVYQTGFGIRRLGVVTDDPHNLFSEPGRYEIQPGTSRDFIIEAMPPEMRPIARRNGVYVAVIPERQGIQPSTSNFIEAVEAQGWEQDYFWRFWEDTAFDRREGIAIVLFLPGRTEDGTHLAHSLVVSLMRLYLNRRIYPGDPIPFAGDERDVEIDTHFLDRYHFGNSRVVENAGIPPFWLPIFKAGEHVAGWEQVYTPGEKVIAWFPVYEPGEELAYVPTFRQVYQPGRALAYVPIYRQIYTPGQNVAYVTQWRPVYQVGFSLAYVPIFRPIYEPGEALAYVPIFRQVYTPGEAVAYEAAFRTVFTPGEAFSTWHAIYQPGESLAAFFHTVYTPGEALNYVTQFRVVYTPGEVVAFVSGFKVVYLVGDRIEPDDPDFPFLPGDLDLGSGITFADLLQFNWRVGRSDAAFLARSLPGQGQIILDNTHERYGPGNFLPGNRIRIRIPGELEIGAAFISQVRPQTDHTTGLKTSTVHIEGALAQLTRSEFEIALFETDSVRTSDIVESALDQADWSDDLRRIDKGQVRLHPAHYTSILGSRALGKTQPVLRAVEEAEVGFIHELRGSHVVFEDRYHRELDDRAAVTTFGGSETDNTVMDIEGVVNPHDEWENVYTGVAIGMERATILSPGKVWEMKPESSILGLISLGGHGTTIVVPADTTITFKVDLVNQEDFRFRERVQSVASWLPVEQSHYEAHRDTDPDANVTNLVFGDVTGQTFRTSRVITIRNPNPAFGVVITRLEIHGRGVGLLGDIALPLIEDEQAELLYHRRILSLAPSVVGDGLNHGGSGLAEGKDYAETLLERYKRPRAASRVVINPLANNETKRIGQHLQISDPVIVQGGYGLDAGEYHVEGMDFQYTASDGVLQMGVFLSERGRRATIVDQTFTPLPGPQSQWAIVHTGAGGALTVPMEADRSYVIGVMAQLPSAAVPMEDDDELLRLVIGTEVRKVWKAIDLPKGEPDWLAGLIRPEEAATATMQLRTEAGITPIVTRLRAVRVDG